MYPERAAQEKGMMLESPLLREQDSRANEAQSPAMLFSLYTENKQAWTHLCLGRTINSPELVGYFRPFGWQLLSAHSGVKGRNVYIDARM